MTALRIRVNKALGARPIIIVFPNYSYVECRDLTVHGLTHFVYDEPQQSVQAVVHGELINMGDDAYYISRSSDA